MQLALRIRQIRLLKGFSQEYMADKMEISQPAYSRIENKAGNCTFYTLTKLAKVLDVKLAYLIDVDTPIE